MAEDNVQHISYNINPSVDSRLDFEKKLTEQPEHIRKRIEEYTKQQIEEEGIMHALSRKDIDSPRYRKAFHKANLCKYLIQAENVFGFDLIISKLKNASKDILDIAVKNRRLKRYSSELSPLLTEYKWFQDLCDSLEKELKGLGEICIQKGDKLSETEENDINDKAEKIEQDLEALREKANTLAIQIDEKKEEIRSLTSEQLRKELIAKAEEAKQKIIGKENLGVLTKIPENADYEKVESIAKDMVDASLINEELKATRVFGDEEIEILNGKNLSEVRTILAAEDPRNITLSYFTPSNNGESNTIDKRFKNYFDKYMKSCRYILPLLNSYEGNQPLIAKLFRGPNTSPNIATTQEQSGNDIISFNDAREIISLCPGISKEEIDRFINVQCSVGAESNKLIKFTNRIRRENKTEEYLKITRELFEKVKNWIINEGVRNLGVSSFTMYANAINPSGYDLKTPLADISKKEKNLITIYNKINNQHTEYEKRMKAHGIIHDRIYETIKQMNPSDCSFDWRFPDIDTPTLKFALETIAKAQKVQRERQIKSVQPICEEVQMVNDYSEGIVIPDKDMAKYNYVDSYLDSDDIIPATPPYVPSEEPTGPRK